MSSKQITKFIDGLDSVNDILDICRLANMTSAKLTNKNKHIYKTNLKKKFMKNPDLFKTVKRLQIENRLRVEDEIDDIMNIPITNTKQSVSHEERKALHDEMYNMLPSDEIFKSKSKSHDERRKQFEEIKDIVDQFRKAKISAKRKEPQIDFEIEGLNEASKGYFNEHIGPFFTWFMNSLNIRDRWVIKYEFRDNTKTKPLDDQHVASLLSQMKREGYLNEVREEYANLEEANYDFFTVGIDELKRISIIKLEDEVENDRKRGPYKTREGRFWKYTLSLPINMERYGIYNVINEETVEKMTKDNCLIYACIQAGIDESTINHMREIIRIRSFPVAKLNKIANECNIAFKVNEVKYDDNGKVIDSHTLRYGDQELTPINLLLVDGHYMVNDKDVCIQSYFIKHYEELKIEFGTKRTVKQLMKISGKRSNGKYRLRYKGNSLTDILGKLFAFKRFKPITLGQIPLYASTIYKEKGLCDYNTLDYDEKWCCKLKAPYAPIRTVNPEKQKLPEGTAGGPMDRKGAFKREHVIYADFECSTDGTHKEFNICFESADGTDKGSYWGHSCAVKFLNHLKTNTLVYFHNLSYDINFIISRLTCIVGTPIIKQSRVMQIEGIYNRDKVNKRLLFKDSYAIISKKLKEFPICFNLKTGEKEVFPYQYYSSELLENNKRIGSISEACKYIAADSIEQFKHNIDSIPKCRLSEDSFDLQKYSNYYCSQDVRILREGFERFRSDLLNEFKLDAYDFVSISSIANKYMEMNVYYPNGNLYDLANKPRDFISRCVQGGRCMCCDNEKQLDISGKHIVDFDAVSLYPSAIARLYTLEGKPKVLTDEMLNTDYLLEHLMTDDQEEPTTERYISAFYVEVKIRKINKPRHFPIIVMDGEYNQGIEAARSSNTCCVMYVNHITFEDLIRFQGCEMEILRGYYYNSRRDLTIRKEIQKLFNLRLQYKKEGNPLQETIKLILNSIYGKTILKPIDSEHKFINNRDLPKYLCKNYTAIIDTTELHNCNKTIVKKYKAIVRHFNFAPLGVDVLAMSKRIMNEVFCLAEDNNIRVFYQDTDSGHYYADDIPKLQQLFKVKYGRELIGKSLGQFHSDFAEVDKGYESQAISSIFVGKKTYIDMLTNEKADIGFHARMKGITQDVIAITANKLYPDLIPCYYQDGIFKPDRISSNPYNYSLFRLYKALYDGEEITFDLCSGSGPCFDMKNNFSIETKSEFIRKLKFD